MDRPKGSKAPEGTIRRTVVADTLDRSVVAQNHLRFTRGGWAASKFGGHEKCPLDRSAQAQNRLRFACGGWAASQFGGHEKLRLVVARTGTRRLNPQICLQSARTTTKLSRQEVNPQPAVETSKKRFGAIRAARGLQGTIWTARAARESHLDSPENSIWTAREAPESHSDDWGGCRTSLDSPGGCPGNHLGSAKEGSRSQFGSPGGSRERFGQAGRLERAICSAVAQNHLRFTRGGWAASKSGGHGKRRRQNVRRPRKASACCGEASGAHWDSPGGSREPFGQPGGSREPFGQPGLSREPVWTAAREAPGTYLDSPGGSRERLGQPGRHQKAGKAILRYRYKAARREAKKAVV